MNRLAVRRAALRELVVGSAPPWLARRRAALRGWRRTRPFWAGLLLILGGAEIMAVPLAPLSVLVSLGVGGLAAIGIGLALAVAGLFLWFTPQARHYVSVNALILSVLSFAATNLGGFVVGMALGIGGSAMGFAWTPRPRGPLPPGRPPGRTLAVALPFVLLAGLVTAPVPGSGESSRAASATPRFAGVPAPSTPPTVTTTRFAPEGFTIAGVSEVLTAAGPRKVMVLRMRAASLTDYRLTTRDNGPELALGADRLDLTGDVTLYLTRFSGCLEGVVCLTFTPDRLPVPPIVPPFVYLTQVEADQALVTSDMITAAGLTLHARARPTGP
ncbi:DUF6114 domain-containing protein [Streptomyces sp. RPT161]|uniref:DUF6114 domain-containing protein n=1 Tax=Streptomyces sp. RPT161 TaxID=3015993 RepID=UPI003FCE1CD1